MEIVKNSAKDCYPAVQKTTLVIMERLQQVLQMEVSPRFIVLCFTGVEESAVSLVLSSCSCGSGRVVVKAVMFFQM